MTSRSTLVSQGTITTPHGFLAGATYVGIKSRGVEALDLGILFSEVPCTAAGIFTTNRIKAAPVLLCQRHLAGNRAQAIIVNSGCANACTGEQGLADAEKITALAAKKLGLQPQDVLIASTGVIGPALPTGLIAKGIESITLSREGGHDLARAITTTDRSSKEAAVKFMYSSEDQHVCIGGIAKGAGMIHPNMATMLCFLATDAAIESGFLRTALQKAVDVSFNMITIDGDTSPNDSAIILANGLAANETIQSGSRSAEEFEKALEQVCISLAKSIVRDGEGATRLIEIVVESALTSSQARNAARTVAGSALVKAAVHGSDPNWGRIIAALGRSGAEIEESRIDLYLDDLRLMADGCPLPFNQEQARRILDRPDVPIRIALNLGNERATAWGCDLSEEYVTINSAYTT